MIRFGYEYRVAPKAHGDNIVHERGYGASDSIAEEGTLVQVRIEK